MAFKDELGNAKANFFMTYYKDGLVDRSKQPITYTFNVAVQVRLQFACIWVVLAFYQKKIASQYIDLQKTLKEVEGFALNEYSNLLMKGDLTTDNEVDSVIEKLSKYTGLSKQDIRNTIIELKLAICKGVIAQ